MKIMSMRGKLNLIFIAIFIVPVAVSYFIMHKYAVDFSKDSIEMLNRNNMKYILSSTNSFFESIYDFSLYVNLEKNIISYFSGDMDDPAFSQKQSAAQDALSSLSFSNPYIKSVSIFSDKGPQIGSGSQILSLTDEERNLAKSYKGFYFWLVTPAGDYNEMDFCRLLRQPANLNNEFGYIKIRLNTDSLDTLLQSETQGDYQYFIVNENNEMIYHTGNLEKYGIPKGITTELLAQYNGDTFFMEENQYYVTPAKLTLTPWYIYSVNAGSSTVSLSKTLQNTFFLFAVLCTIFCFFLAFLFTTIIVSPLKKLSLLMARIGEEDYSVRFHPKGRDEIGVLAAQFDKMTEKLETLYNEVYVSNLKLKESKLAILQAQINPHFLYNTLDTIYWMAKFHNNEDVCQMVSALSRLFRLSLSGGENDLVLLEGELEHIRCYLYIQKIRYQEQLTYQINNKSNPKNILVPKLILQPIIENAIHHGIGNHGHGHIDICISESDNCLIYEVSDDGGTADAEEINKMLRKPPQGEKGIGLKNINDRIVIRYSEKYGISCKVEDGKTIFRVVLPILKGEVNPSD